MKGTLSLLVLAAATALVAASECPSDWTQELLLRHEDCNKFYKCTFGVPVEQDCWGHLHFNLATWECDWPENVDCEDRNVPGVEPETEEESEPVPESSESIEPVPESSESIEPVPESSESIEPAPESSESIEPVPESSESIEPAPESPESIEPVPESSESIEPVPESSESIEPAPDTSEVIEPAPESSESIEPAPESSEQESSPEDASSEFLENGCPVDPHVHWLLPHENDCNLFYYCVWGGKQLRNCAGTLHFNRELQVCDWSWDAGCTISANLHSSGRKAYRGL